MNVATLPDPLAMASRSSSEEYRPAVSQPDVSLSSEKLFSSYETKALSASRIASTRLPDIMQHDQNKQVVNASHPAIFIGYIQEGEESSAKLSITNLVDPDVHPCPSFDFSYTDGYVLTDTLDKPSRRVNDTTQIPRGCRCNNDSGVCNPRTCSCYALHEHLAPNPWVELTKDNSNAKHPSDLRGQFAYEDGRLRQELILMPRAPIWECNSYCGCTGDCRNRVVQKGRTASLDIFKAAEFSKGWGIRAKQKIKAGSFITVYAGELLSYEESERRNARYDEISTTYMLDIDLYHIKRKLIFEPYVSEQKKEGIVLDEEDEEVQLEAENWATETDTALLYSVDAGLWGNISRYFNHSCDPNMEIYPVYTEERDIRRPFLAFFAKFDIQEGVELTFAYDGRLPDDVEPATANLSNEDIRAVAKEHLQSRDLGTEITLKTSDGKHNLTSMKCGCGAAKCRGTVFLRGD